jgi:hypothetical protein
VALSVALLAIDENRHGQMIYSIGDANESEFKEVEGPMLKSNLDITGESRSEVNILEEIVKRAQQMAREKQSAA